MAMKPICPSEKTTREPVQKVQADDQHDADAEADHDPLDVSAGLPSRRRAMPQPNISNESNTVSRFDLRAVTMASDLLFLRRAQDAIGSEEQQHDQNYEHKCIAIGSQRARQQSLQKDLQESEYVPAKDGPRQAFPSRRSLPPRTL